MRYCSAMKRIALALACIAASAIGPAAPFDSAALAQGGQSNARAGSGITFVSEALIPSPMRSLRDVDEPIEIELDTAGTQWGTRVRGS